MPYDLFRKIIDIDVAGVWLCSQIAPVRRDCGERR